MSEQIRAGWYRDPWNATNFRWWDGQRWTVHTRAAHVADRFEGTNPMYTHGVDPYMINKDRLYLGGNPLLGFGIAAVVLALPFAISAIASLFS